jgi:hypothetical protein
MASFPVPATAIPQPPTQFPTQNHLSTPSPTPSPTSLPSSFYEACVADTIQGALESGTPPDVSWCARWNDEYDGPAMPTIRPVTRIPVQTQRPLVNTAKRTRAPLEPFKPQVQSAAPPRPGTLISKFATIMPRTTTQPLSVLMRSSISQILSRLPVYVAPTRAPAPAISRPTQSPTTQYSIQPTPPSTNSIPTTTVPRFPHVVSFVHEDEWMNRGVLEMLTLRNGKLTLGRHASKDMSQVFVIDASGEIRVVEGQGDRVVIDGRSTWNFSSRTLDGSFKLETQDKKRLSYSAGTSSVIGSATENGSSIGWFIVPLGRLA